MPRKTALSVLQTAIASSAILIGLALTVPTGGLAMAADAILTLAGSEWGYANENGPNERFVQFGGDSLVSGSGGCNRFSGRYDQAGDGIAIKDMGVTLMECFDSAVVDREAAFFKILNACRRIEATHLVLKLYGVDGALLAELARRDVD